MTELAVTTRPVFRIDGQVRGELARDLDSLLVEETTAGLKHMRVRLVAQGPADAGDPLVESQLYLDGALVDFGQRIEVILGSEGETRVVFLGQITAIEAEFGETSEPHVTLFAEDRLLDLRMVRRARSYKDVSDADIAREIAGFHGFQAEGDADGPVHELVHQ